MIYTRSFAESFSRDPQLRRNLEQSSLVLCLVDPVVFPHSNCRNQQNSHASCGNGAVLLAITPGIVDGIACGASDRVQKLCCRSTEVNGRGIGPFIRRKSLKETFGECTGVDGSRDGRPNGATNTTTQADEREHHRYTFTVRSCHDSHVFTNNQSTTSESNKNLAHDDVVDRAILATEMNHQAGTQKHKRDAEKETEPLEFLGVSNVYTKNRAPKAGPNVVDLCHVPGQGDIKIIHYHNEVVVVLIPAVERKVQCRGANAGPEDTAVFEKFPANELYSRKVCLPDRKYWE